MRLARLMWTAATLCAALAVPSIAQVQNPPAAAGMTVAQQQQVADAATAAANAQQTANDAANAAAAARAAIPTPANTTPPGVADSGAIGTMSTMYALANHTHASKARKGRVLAPVTNGTVYVDVAYSTPFTSSPPVCAVVAETTAGDTNVVNAQIDGTPTMTGMRIRVTRTAITVASLLGLNILSVPTQIATWTHYVCLEP